MALCRVMATLVRARSAWSVSSRQLLMLRWRKAEQLDDTLIMPTSRSYNMTHFLITTRGTENPNPNPTTTHTHTHTHTHTWHWKQLHTRETDLNNFGAENDEELWTKCSCTRPPYVKNVTTLPCEMMPLLSPYK